MQALAEKQLSTRAPGKGVNILMGVPGAKAAENYFPVIRPVIPVGVCKEDEVLSLVTPPLA